VRERDYFYLAGFGFWGVLAGMGLAWCWAVVAERVNSPRAYLLTSPLLLIAFLPLALNARWADRSEDWAARDWAWDLLSSVEPYGVIFTNGDNDTFPLWYLQEVEGLRQDVTVIVGQYLFTSWYLSQLQELTAPERQRPYVHAQVEGLYPAADVPTEPITSLTREQMDEVVGGTLPEDQTVRIGNVAFTFPEGMTLDRSHRLALAVIRDAVGRRPIYFSGTSGMMEQMGLHPFAVRQGLVAKLVLDSAEREANPSLIQGAPEYGGEWFDLDRSLTLYDDIYRYRGLKERAIWPDRATLNIPFHYYALALQLSDVARQAGRSQELVDRLEADAASFSVVAGGGSEGTPAPR
jgi:hypothetical protein